MTYFSSFGLAEPITRALDAKGYTEPTPIQVQAIPGVMDGRDLCGIAQTGTGKTAAFALPTLHRLSAAPKTLSRGQVRCLVLAPTRELASQIAESFAVYGKYLKLRVETVFGGVPINRQERAMQYGVDVLVATPGRLIDLIDRGALTLRMVEVLILDEADQMLDLGFIHALKRIVTMVPKQRQTLFFSATMPRAIEELASRFLTDPLKISVKPAATTAERVDQRVIFVNQAEKPALLQIELRAEGVERSLVFTRTKHGADRVVRQLGNAGIVAVAIHGNKSQGQREKALDSFKKGQVKVLIATDIAARGIDVDGVSHVFNYELPNVPESYVHRIGRTARAGAAGQAVAFCAEDERPYLKDIEKLTRMKIDVTPLPADFRALVSAAAKVERAAPAAPRERDERAPHGRRDSRAAPSSGGRGASGGGSGGGGRSFGGKPGGSSRPGRDPRVVVNPLHSRGR
ncbi:DEAD/DEAH box helicase [Glacieibacterium sp.]|uniref:DEAD/DEAH box helicase n=1 Tax=Glacieibacterium sp. TaxID=2860237 RepID=UPI003B008408